jgi:hypothetical protein
VHLIEAVWILRINAHEAVYALRRRQDAVEPRRSNSVPLGKADGGELDADVWLETGCRLRGEELTRISGICICRSARGGLAESIKGDGEAATLQVKCDLNGNGDGVTSNEAANRSAAPRGALYELAEPCCAA